MTDDANPTAPFHYDPVPAVARELGLSPGAVAAVVAMLDEGNTVPFIARYRKERTGALDEVQIRAIEDQRTYLVELETRRAAILASVAEQGKLTPELEAKLRAVQGKSELEDLYAPYRPRRKTRASVARDKGLEPLAQLILAQGAEGDPAVAAAGYVSEQVGSADDALAGARDIVAEIVADTAEIRGFVRREYAEHGEMASEVVPGKADEPTKFEQYYQFKEAVKTIPSHRFLAIRRGEAEGVLRAHVVVDAARVEAGILRLARLDPASPWAGELRLAAADALKRLLAPSVENDVRAELKQRSDAAAVDIFAGNLRNLMLAPPLGSAAVIGVDPGLRTGCKCAAIDATGRFLGTVTVYISQGDAQLAKAKDEFIAFVTRFAPRAIAVGNGTGGREAESFVKRALADAGLTGRVALSAADAATESTRSATPAKANRTIKAGEAKHGAAAGANPEAAIDAKSEAAADPASEAKSEVATEAAADSGIEAKPETAIDAAAEPAIEATGTAAAPTAEPVAAAAAESVAAPALAPDPAPSMVPALRGGAPAPFVVQVNEAGASVYSASDLAREEFPELDLTIRGAISIARRLQDPLAELVKIEPKSIGVGQYQHDVHQPLLGKRLGDVVEDCVNHVGVELNTASAQLLGYVAGIGKSLAKKIVSYRDSHGAFAARGQLMEVSGLGPKAFEQAAGFLRIAGAAYPLDQSAVHPERYRLVETIARDLGVELPALIGNQQLVDAIEFSKYVSDDVGEPTLRDIAAELAKPGRDPRAEFSPPKFRDDVTAMEDLKVGMVLEGIVTNVTAFGAFVDIGVHNDGLVHVSQLAEQFVKDPSEVVKVGQKLTVRVLEVDNQRKRIALSAKRGGGAGQQPQRQPRRDGDGRDGRDAGGQRPPRNRNRGGGGGGQRAPQQVGDGGPRHGDPTHGGDAPRGAESVAAGQGQGQGQGQPGRGGQGQGQGRPRRDDRRGPPGGREVRQWTDRSSTGGGDAPQGELPASDPLGGERAAAELRNGGGPEGARRDGRGPQQDRGRRDDRGPHGGGPQGRRDDRGPYGGGLPGRRDDRSPQGERAPYGDRGPQGDRAPYGDRGPQGERGPQDRGPQGDRGPQDRGPQDRGPQGDRSPQDRGPQGDRGPQDRGPQDRGPQGDRGPQDRGPQDRGPQGDRAPYGARDPQGDRGPQGPRRDDRGPRRDDRRSDGPPEGWGVSGFTNNPFAKLQGKGNKGRS
jgi:competence ComEA-like helix-hairpin-helix protein